MYQPTFADIRCLTHVPRTMDITMLSWFNAREREKTEWEDMFRKADPRFTDIKSFVPKEAGMRFIEATWRYMASLSGVLDWMGLKSCSRARLR